MLQRNATLALLVSGVVLIGGVSFAQPRPAAPVAAAKPLQAQALKLQPITVAPTLKASLRSKKTFDISKLTFVRQDADGSVLREKNGQEFRLLEASRTTTKSRRATATVQPVVEQKYRSQVTAWKPGQLSIQTASPPIVDHRSWQTPPKNQGGRPTCSAFATVSGLEALLKKNGTTVDLSENDVFNGGLKIASKTCGNGGVATWATVDEAMDGVCLETKFPYTSSCPGATPSACNAADGYKLKSVYAMYTPSHGVPDVAEDLWHRADNPFLLESFLDSGKDIVYAVDVAGTDWGDGTKETGVIDVQIDGAGNPADPYGAHAMLLVGYSRPGKYFVFKNSYGPDSGHDGYVYLSYDYVQAYAWYGFTVLE